MHHQYDLSLILACYNEAQILTDSLDQIIHILDQTNWTYEIILIDDKSTDATVQLIRQVLRRYPRKHLSAYFHSHNQGRGKTVAEGFLRAQGKIIGYVDIDLEIPAWYIPRFVEALDHHTDAAVAQRIYDFNFHSLPRWLFSKSYSWLRQQILPLPVADTEAGYKFFKRVKILPVVKRCQDNHWFWDTEIVARALQAKLKFLQIPVVFIRRQDKTSTVKLFPDTFDYFIKLFRYCRQLRLKS